MPIEPGPPASALPQQRLEALYELSRALPLLLDWAELGRRVVEAAVASVHAERGILFLRDERGEPKPEVVIAADSKTVTSALETSRRILDHALSGEATLSDDATHDLRFDSPS